MRLPFTKQHTLNQLAHEIVNEMDYVNKERIEFNNIFDKAVELVKLNQSERHEEIIEKLLNAISKQHEINSGLCRVVTNYSKIIIEANLNIKI